MKSGKTEIGSFFRVTMSICSNAWVCALFKKIKQNGGKNVKIAILGYRMVQLLGPNIGFFDPHNPEKSDFCEFLVFLKYPEVC